MENKEYIQDLKKLINGEMVAAMQYKAIADSIVGEKNLSYIQTHCDEHYQEELSHYTLLVNTLMQREEDTELNLSNIIEEALPETVEMTSNNCMDAAKFFSKSEEAAIKAYLEFHEKVKDVDPDLDDIITGIISDERDHKLDFDRVLNSDEELEVEESKEETDDSDEDGLEDEESENTELEKKGKFNFDFSDDEDEKVEESRKMRSRRVRESRRPIRNRKLRETKICYDLLDGNFKPWSGAVSRWEEILDNDLLEELNDYLEEVYPEGMTETELNDFLWFDGDEFLDHFLGRDIDDEDEDFEDEEDSDEFEEFVNRKINRVREQSERPSRSFVEKKLHNKEKYSDSINRFARRIR